MKLTGNKALRDKFYDIFEIPYIMGPSIQSGEFATQDIVKKRPPITHSLFMDLEQVLIDRYGSIQYFKYTKYDGQADMSWSCGTNFEWETNYYEKSGKSRLDTLLSLLIECRLNITEDVQKVFAEYYGDKIIAS